MGGPTMPDPNGSTLPRNLPEDWPIKWNARFTLFMPRGVSHGDSGCLCRFNRCEDVWVVTISRLSEASFTFQDSLELASSRPGVFLIQPHPRGPRNDALVSLSRLSGHTSGWLSPFPVTHDNSKSQAASMPLTPIDRIFLKTRCKHSCVWC